MPTSRETTGVLEQGSYARDGKWSGGKGQEFVTEIDRTPPPNPDTNPELALPWYWIPNRRKREPDKEFMVKLAELDEKFGVGWDSVHERWSLWWFMGQGYFSKKLDYLEGWWPLYELLEDSKGNYIPLDNRVLLLAFLCLKDKNPDYAKHGERYAQQALDQMKRDQDKSKELLRDEAHAVGGEIYDHEQISVTTIPGDAGHRSGRKSADYDSGE